MGPVEFFDEPTLVDAIKDPRSAPMRRPLPDELLKQEGPDKDGLWPRREEITRWVAARVDLGIGQFSNPIQTGRAQANAIVQLAIFQNGESTWEPLAGVIHLIDGRLHSSERFHGDWPSQSLLAENDWTASRFPDIASTIGSHLPVVDAALRRILREVNTLNVSTRSTEPDLLTHDIRVRRVHHAPESTPILA